MHADTCYNMNEPYYVKQKSLLVTNDPRLYDFIYVKCPELTNRDRKEPRQKREGGITANTHIEVSLWVMGMS